MEDKIKEIISDLLSIKDDIEMEEIDENTIDLIESCIYQLEQLIKNN